MKDVFRVILFWLPFYMSVLTRWHRFELPSTRSVSRCQSTRYLKMNACHVAVRRVSYSKCGLRLLQFGPHYTRITMPFLPTLRQPNHLFYCLHVDSGCCARRPPLCHVSIKWCVINCTNWRGISGSHLANRSSPDLGRVCQ